MEIEDYANGRHKAASTSRFDLLQQAAIQILKSGDSRGTFVAWYGDHPMPIGRGIEAFQRIKDAPTGVFFPSFSWEGRPKGHPSK
jgi:hypothetical protein